MPLIDMTGLTVADWTVLRRYRSLEGRGAYWVCRCRCGNESVVRGASLRAGTSLRCKLCSVARRRGDLTGQVFGGWTVLGPGAVMRNGMLWRVRCACGTEGAVTTWKLRSRHSTQCRSCGTRSQRKAG